MAGQSRILKLSILGDTSDLVKGLKKADDETRTAGDKIKGAFKAVGVAAAAAGVAVGAFAVKLAVDGVKAAIEDEAAQVRLATALKNTTGATKDQIAAIEDQILKTSLATGIADDQLRPALSRLAVATGDTAKSQKLLNLALDISASTGKPLEAVTQALGKAYEGNTTSLSRLGVGLGAADIKALGLEGTISQLSDTFGGAAATQAETFQGKMARLTVAIDETKEGIGAALLPILSELFGYVNQYVVPIVIALADRFQAGVGPAVSRVRDIFKNFLLPALQDIWQFLKSLFGPIVEAIQDRFKNLSGVVTENRNNFKPLFDLLKALWAFVKDFLAPIIGVVLAKAFNIIITVIDLVIKGIGFLIQALKPAIDLVASLFNGVSKVAGFLGLGGDSKSTSGFGNISIPSGGSIPTLPTTSPTTTSPTTVNNTVNVTGTVLDPEGTARTVTKVLTDSVNRAGTYSGGAGGGGTFGLLVFQ
jgi:hypothetical protein